MKAYKISTHSQTLDIIAPSWMDAVNDAAMDGIDPEDIIKIEEVSHG